MSLQSTLISILDDAVFNGELYYIQGPDWSGPGPSVFGVFSIVGGQSFQNLEGDIPTARPRVQISVYAVSAEDLINTVAAVNAAMLAANASDVLLNYSTSVPVDGFEAEARRYYSHMDFYCWQNEDIPE